ncbi:hypothetical protein GGI25_000163 [Coemansia spiralis]|uniref:Pentatricopeptide repeat-containing protein n=2 Tax=Coemansia TaxID=4863 RepID=A0A9W8L1S3_9FUNG|nr:hypothetical protein EDC05_002807 [Coemansia umbellata]KAJ2621821.1 hypothetical protein GGI26_003801 [Coemansia sp. RSA 1358]KAJ2681208.1 hypothetical protein GGI25_000163 [Coemansia spiralis]
MPCFVGRAGYFRYRCDTFEDSGFRSRRSRRNRSISFSIGSDVSIMYNTGAVPSPVPASSQSRRFISSFSTRNSSSGSNTTRSGQGGLSTTALDPISEDKAQELYLLERLLLQPNTESLVKREAIWSAYNKIAYSEFGIVSFSSHKVVTLLEILANDRDRSRMLERISKIAKDISDRRRFSPEELATIKRICGDEGDPQPQGLRKPYFRSVDEYALSNPTKEKEALLTANWKIPERDEIGDIPSAFAKRIAAVTEEDLPLGSFKLRKLLKTHAVALDSACVWRAYHADLEKGISNIRHRSLGRDIAVLVVHCSHAGMIVGGSFLKQIELDSETYPWLFPDRHIHLIEAYARLGAVGHSRRCYLDGCANLQGKDTAALDWSMCAALFRSSRQKEAHAIFDGLVTSGKATYSMSVKMIQEYTRMRNPDAAFAQFDYICKLGNKPTYTLLCTLATASTLYGDESQSSERLQEIMSCLKSWNIVPDIKFFTSILSGYDMSNQNIMFDSLAEKLITRFQYSNQILNQVLSRNAVRRKLDDRVQKTAPSILQDLCRFPKVAFSLTGYRQPHKLRELLDISRFPENNFTANMKLMLALDSPNMAASPDMLLRFSLDMVNQGFTPTFKHFYLLLRKLWLCGGHEMAIEAFEEMTAAGVPCSIDILFFMVGMYLRNSTPEHAIKLFEELRHWLKDSNFGGLKPHTKSMRALMQHIVEKKDVAYAQDVIVFLRSLPFDPKTLPYSPLVGYYVSNNMVDKSRSMITYIAQHNIPLEPSVVKLCCNDFADNSSITDFANFLRYLHRTHALKHASDSVFEAFFVRCLHERKPAYLEWIISVLAHRARYSHSVWHVVFARLFESADRRSILLITRMVIEAAEDKIGFAQTLLAATKGLASTVTIADAVLVVTQELSISDKKAIYTSAFRVLNNIWVKYYKQRYSDSDSPVSQVHLIKVMERHIHQAIGVDIKHVLIRNALVALSTSSTNMYPKDFVEILYNMPSSQIDSRLCEAVILGCSRRGYVSDIDDILKMMWERGLTPTTTMLTSIMTCFIRAPPPRKAPPQPAQPETSDVEEEELAFLDILQEQQMYNQHQEESVNNEQCPEDTGANIDARLEFRIKCLAKILTLWREFEFRGLMPNRAAYSILLQAYILAQNHKQAEELIRDMVDSGIEHNDVTAHQWLTNRLAQDDIDGALEILGAIGNNDRFAELFEKDKRFAGLDKVPYTVMPFASIIKYYLKVGMLKEGILLLQHMHQQKLKGTTWLYDEILSAIYTSDDSGLLLHFMRQLVKYNIPINQHMKDVINACGARIKSLLSANNEQ